MKPGVLIPGCGQPLGGDCGRHTAAGHKAEVSRSWRRHQARIRGGGEGLDHRLRILRLLRQGSAECEDEVSECRGGKDVTAVDAREEVIGEFARPGEERMRHAEKVSPPFRTNVGPTWKSGLLNAGCDGLL